MSTQLTGSTQSINAVQPTSAIAIVGGGFSGAMVAVHLLRSAHHPLTIYLIEPRLTLGCGVAYSTPLDCHLMNVPVKKISAFADQPDHFLQWIQQLSSISAFRSKLSDSNSKSFAETDCNPCTPDSFVPRRIYGQYMQAVVAEAEAIASKKACLKRVVDEAVAINPVGDRALITLQSGAVLSVNRVVLALGNFPPRNPTVVDDSFYQSDRYVRSGWSSSHLHQHLHQLPTHASVVLIGSGLTAIDWAIALHQQGHQAPIHLVSRRGLSPQAHALPQSHVLPQADALPDTKTIHPFKLEVNPDQATLRGTLRHLRRVAIEAMADGHDWQAVVDALRPYTNSVWQRLSLVEKQRFLRHLKPYWDSHRHRLAPAIAQELENMRRSGQLQIHAGRVHTYQEDANGVDVVIRPRGRQQPITLRANLVVNCTGSGCDYAKLTHPLVKQLFKAGLLKPDALALGLETTNDGALIGAGDRPSILYTLGSPRRGQLWETTAIPDIREQAQQLAETLLSSLQVPLLAI